MTTTTIEWMFWKAGKPSSSWSKIHLTEDGKRTLCNQVIPTNAFQYSYKAEGDECVRCYRKQAAEFTVDKALGFARELGVVLGRSDVALDNQPTFAQARAARQSMVAEYPGLDRMGGSDFWPVFSSAFEDGYATGKLDPEGARRRVAVKRAEASALSKGQRP